MSHKSARRFLWKHIKPYRWHYLVMLMAPVLGGAHPLLGSYAIKLFIDVISKDSGFEYADFLFPIMILISNELVINLVFRISNMMHLRTQPTVRANILLHAYGRLQQHSYRFFQNNFSGALSAKIKGLIEGYRRFWADMHHGFLLKTMRLFYCLVGLLFFCPILGVCVFVWALVFTVVMFKLYNGSHRKAIYDETQSSQKCIGDIGDRIANINTIRSFASYDRETKLLRKALLKEYVPKQRRYYESLLFVNTVGSLIYLLGISGFLYLIISLVRQEKMDVAGIAFVGGLMFKFLGTLWACLGSLSYFVRSMGNLRSSMSILETPREDKDLPNAQPLKVDKAEVVFKNVSFTYGDSAIEVFENFNLTIKPGEKIGLVGSSGAGKSSLVKLLLRYFSCDSGHIYIGGQEISQVTKKSLRDQIAIVPQDTTLFHRSVMENIVYGKPDATEQEVIAACKEAQIHDEIMALPQGYQSSVGEGGGKLSGGQKQRLIIARALLKLQRASILILDEASAALDSAKEKDLQKAIDRLTQNKQKTVIAIAHRLSTLRNMDSIIVLEDGKIIEQGTHEALLAQEGSHYKKLWDHQVMGAGVEV